MAAKDCRTPSATDKPTLKNRVGETAADEQPFGAIGFEPPKLFKVVFPRFILRHNWTESHTQEPEHRKIHDQAPTHLLCGAGGSWSDVYQATSRG